MKRVLSLVLVLVLALGSIPFAFAADTMTAGETLKGYGLAKGVDAEGNLNEEGMLTRAEMMVMISRLLDVEQEAMTYAIPSTSKDAQGHWAARYIAYAEQVGKWTDGIAVNMFGPDQKVTNQMVAKFMLTALGYDANWDTAVIDATALGLMEGVSGDETSYITRGDVFKAALNTINQPKKGSTVKLGVTLGVMEEEVDPVVALEGAVIDTVKATGNALVTITFEEDVDMAAAAAATYVITTKADAAKTIAVNKVNVESATVVTLETDAMVAGTAYKISFADLSSFFTGVAKSSDAPKVTSVKGTDTNVLEVKFDMNVDKMTAEDIANYSINTIGTVVKAELNSDRQTVTLTTEGFTKVAAHKLTVENVLSVDGKMISKTTKTFYPTFDKSAPTIDAIKNINTNNNKEIYVFFKDDHGVDKDAAQDIANYSIEGLEIISAKASKDAYDSSKSFVDSYSKDSDYYNRVTLVTSEQKANTKYTLKVNNMIDGSTSKNVATKELTGTFYGGTADKTAPSLQNIEVLSSTLIRISFQEINKLDPATALDISNYSVDKDELTVVEAKFKDNDSDLKSIDLTVSEMEDNKSYKLKVNNISDTFNNAMSKETTKYFQGKVVKAAPVLKNVYSSGLSKVIVEFSQPVTNSAKEATNYSLDSSVGAPTSAKFQSGSNTVVELTFPDLTANKTYKLTVNGVENFSGFGMSSATKSFIATRTTADFTKPTVRGVSFTNKGLLRVDFSETVKLGTTPNITISGNGLASATYPAKYVIGEDDDVVTFNVEALNNNDTQQASDKVAYVMSFSNITDIAGNEVDYTAKNDSFTTDGDDYSITNDSIEIVGWSQESVTTVRLFFNDTVKVSTSPITVSTRVFDVESDDTDKSVVVFTLQSGMLSKDEKLVFDVDTDILDLAGRSTRNYSSDYSKVTYEMFIKDTTAPTLLEVIAVDKNTIEMTYDEDLSSAGSYTIKDSDDNTISNSAEKDGKVVTLTTTTDLKSSKFYVVKQGTPARDLSNNYATVVTDGFEFVGSDATGSVTTLAGVAVINGYTVQVKNTSNLKSGEYTITGTGSTISTAHLFVSGSEKVTNPASTKTANLTVEKITPFVKDVTYTVKVPNEYGNSTITFKGIVERDNLSVSSITTTSNGGATIASITLRLNGLTAPTDSNNYTALIGITTSGSTLSVSGGSTVVNADTILFDVAVPNLVSGSNIIVTVLDDSGNPIRTSNVFKIQDTKLEY